MYANSWDSYDLVIAEVVSAVGYFCVLSLFEQYRLASKQTNFSNPFLPNWVMIWITGFCMGSICIFSTQMLTFMSLGFANDTSSSVAFRLGNIIAAIFGPMILSSIGLVICCYNKIYVKDELDTINEYITETQTKTIQEIRAMRHKDELLKDRLLSGMGSIIAGGLFVGSSMLLSEFCLLFSFSTRDVAYNIVAVTGNVILCWAHGVLLMWILFRLLSLFPFNENLRSACLIILVVVESASRLISIHMTSFSLRDPSKERMISRDVLEPNLLGAIGAVALILLSVILADMRISYNCMNQVISHTDQALKKMKKRWTTSAKNLFADEYSELRKESNKNSNSSNNGGNYRMRRGTPPFTSPSPSKASGLSKSPDSGSRSGSLVNSLANSLANSLTNTPRDRRPSHIELDFGDNSGHGNGNGYGGSGHGNGIGNGIGNGNSSASSHGNNNTSDEDTGGGTTSRNHYHHHHHHRHSPPHQHPHQQQEQPQLLLHSHIGSNNNISLSSTSREWESGKTVSTASVSLSERTFGGLGFDTDRSTPRNKSMRIQFSDTISDKESTHRMTHVDSKMSNSTASSSMYSRSSRTARSESSMSLGLAIEDDIEDEEEDSSGTEINNSNSVSHLTGEGYLGTGQLSTMFKHTFVNTDMRKYIIHSTVPSSSSLSSSSTALATTNATTATINTTSTGSPVSFSAIEDMTTVISCSARAKASGSPTSAGNSPINNSSNSNSNSSTHHNTTSPSSGTASSPVLGSPRTTGRKSHKRSIVPNLGPIDETEPL